MNVRLSDSRELIYCEVCFLTVAVVESLSGGQTKTEIVVLHEEL